MPFIWYTPDMMRRSDADALKKSINDLSINIDRLSAKVDTVITQETRLMASFDELVAATTAESTRLDSFITFFNGVEQQLKDALANAGGLTPAQQAVIDSTFAQLNTNVANIDAAIAANTPVVAPPVPPVVPPGDTGATGTP